MIFLFRSGFSGMICPRGFGANHNAAFNESKSDYFCILNPDIRIEMDPFPALIDDLANPRVGVVAPKIVNPRGEVEDSARLSRPLARLSENCLASLQYWTISWARKRCHQTGSQACSCCFEAPYFEELHGFDDRFFLYYEDVDLVQAPAQTRLRSSSGAVGQYRS
jgi:GT2 family glycosyltransferase